MMLRLLARLTLSILSNAIGLLAASVLIDGFSIELSSFIIAVLLFSAATTILGPLIAKIALTNASYLMGGIALVTTLVGLIITNLLSDGISISGLDSWVLATLIVWLFSVLGSVLLPLILFKKVLENSKEAKS